MRNTFLSECLSALSQVFRGDAEVTRKPDCAKCPDPRDDSITKRMEMPLPKAFWQRRSARMRLHDADTLNNQDGDEPPPFKR
jgi:hypothetical protein